jgi:septum formation protein
MIADTPALLLASASPRRRELLRYLGVPFRVTATDAEERETPTPRAVLAALPPADGVPPRAHPALLAWRKANAAAPEADGGVLLAADTIVVLDGEVLNKPVDADDACAMLRRLSGRTHMVYTGLCVLARTGPVFEVVRSLVEIAPLDDATITGYVATGEPLDKAGAYGIQGLGGRLVRRVEGSYTNVVGLPLPATHRLLSAAGLPGLADPAAAYRRWLADQGKEALPCPPTSP